MAIPLFSYLVVAVGNIPSGRESARMPSPRLVLSEGHLSPFEGEGLDDLELRLLISVPKEII